MLDNLIFKFMLTYANHLYLGCSVLVLLDLSYQSRFWTQYELWLSLQEGTSDGLVPADPSVSRSHLVAIHSGTQDLAESLKKMWRTKNTDQARTTLSARDVKVTNLSDKDVRQPAPVSCRPSDGP